MHGRTRLHWIWGMIVAALVVAGASSPVAARPHHHLHVAAAGDHKAWAPVNGHHFDLKTKHHRAFHHAIRRFSPEPVLASCDAGVPCPSRLEPISAAADLARVCIVQASRPPPTGPPAV